jgi:hypothetical protein
MRAEIVAEQLQNEATRFEARDGQRSAVNSGCLEPFVVSQSR